MDTDIVVETTPAQATRLADKLALGAITLVVTAVAGVLAEKAYFGVKSHFTSDTQDAAEEQ